MFIKLVILLLLVIVVVSLLTGRRSGQGGAPKPKLRPLMLRVALVLLVLTGVIAALHLSG